MIRVSKTYCKSASNVFVVVVMFPIYFVSRMRALFFINYMKLFLLMASCTTCLCILCLNVSSLVRRAHNTHEINWWARKWIAREKRYIFFLLRSFFCCFLTYFYRRLFKSERTRTIIHIHKWNRWLLLRMASVLFSIVIETNSRKVRVWGCEWVQFINIVPRITKQIAIVWILLQFDWRWFLEFLQVPFSSFQFWKFWPNDYISNNGDWDVLHFLWWASRIEKKEKKKDTDNELNESYKCKLFSTQWTKFRYI